MRALLIGAVLAAVVLYVWGFVVWGLMPYNPFTAASDDAALSEALLATLPASGIYLVPNQGDSMEDYEAAAEAARRGPYAMIFVQRDGTDTTSGLVMFVGFLHILATTLLLAFLLRLVAPALPRYGQRWAFVALFGLIVAVWARLGEPIWWHLPWDYHLLYFVSDLGSGALAGLVLARFVRGRDDRLAAA